MFCFVLFLNMGGLLKFSKLFSLCLSSHADVEL